MSEVLTDRELFLDPFTGEMFDPIASHEVILERYKSGEVEHDYTADRFLEDTQALMMDAQFMGMYAEAQSIAARMHILCGEDHNLAQTMQNNEAMRALFGDKDEHSDSDGHNHGKGSDKNHATRLGFLGSLAAKNQHESKKLSLSDILVNIAKRTN
jgi:hypothetical protein